MAGGALRRRNAVLETLELFRTLEPGLWVNSIVAYLYVCENEGINVRELAYACRLNVPTASRSVRALAPPDAESALAPALGLVELRPDPNDGRGRRLFLTEQGRALRDRIDGVIRAAVPIAEAA